MVLKYLLLPLAWLYGFAVLVRNKLYDAGILPVYRSRIPSVIIGNLQAGGSGKTPMTAYLYEKLSDRYRISILSRGYGRKSKGLLEAAPGTGPEMLGDEPYWYYTTLPGARVIVSEKRAAGMSYIEGQGASNLMLLDDAYQHRAVEGDVRILLTDFAKPYTGDLLLPAGRLREQVSGAIRAHIIIVTKCPASLTEQNKRKILERIRPVSGQYVYFTAIGTDGPKPWSEAPVYEASQYKSIVAVSGIAGPESFENICRKYHSHVSGLRFRDHHQYTAADAGRIAAACPPGTALVCTEKDAVKLMQPGLRELLPLERTFILPVKPVFLFGEEQSFLHVLEKELARKRESDKK